MTDKRIYGSDVQRCNLTLPPRYVRDLDALAEKLTGGNRSAMTRRLVDMGMYVWGDDHGRIPDWLDCPHCGETL